MLKLLFLPSLFLVVVAVPSVVFQAGIASMSTGVYISSLICILLLLLYFVFPRQSILLKKKRLMVILFILLVIIFHANICFYIYENFDYKRFFYSYFFLIVLIAAAICFATILDKVNQCYFDLSVKCVFWTLALSSVFGYFRYSPFDLSGNNEHPVLFFNEPSHYALAFLPFLLYMVVQAPEKKKIYYLLGGYLIGLVVTNFTLIIGVTLILFITLPAKKVFLALTMLSLLVLLNISNLSYFTERASISKDSTNASSLVFASGYERAYLNLVESYGLGVGFQQFGIAGNQGAIMILLEEYNLKGLNQLDGGSVFTKFVGELGIMAIVLMLVYLAFCNKYIILLRNQSSAFFFGKRYKEIFFLSHYVMYLVDFFVRGAAYFSSFSFLFLVSIMWLLFYKGGNDGRER